MNFQLQKIRKYQKNYQNHSQNEKKIVVFIEFEVFFIISA